MIKRLFPLMLVLGIAMTVAPSAMAQYCQRCASYPTYHCVNTIRVFGYPECVADETGCTFQGDVCEPQTAAASLASEYTVASVERIDEPAVRAADEQKNACATTSLTITR
jgi:hypothetical protein